MAQSKERKALNGDLSQRYLLILCVCVCLRFRNATVYNIAISLCLHFEQMYPCALTDQKALASLFIRDC